MIIQHNIMALNAHRQLGGNNTMVSKNLEKLSSGYRINRAGDDAAGLAISEKMRAQIKGLEVAQSNAQDGISLIQTAEGALAEVHSMLNRMVELAQQSANGTIDDSVDRAAIAAEVTALTDEIDRIASSTNFNGISLLNGDLDTAFDTDGLGAMGEALTLQVGDTDDTFQKVAVEIKVMTSGGLGLDTVDVGSQSTAATAINTIKTAINTVSSNRGNLGALQNRLEHTINNLAVSEENMTAAESRIRDVDMAKEMMEFTKNNVLTQAAQAMLAQANQQPQSVLQLLR